MIDLFLALNAPAAPAGANEITLAGTKYTVSGPRGAQFPLELAVLHSEKVRCLAPCLSDLPTSLPRARN